MSRRVLERPTEGVGQSVRRIDGVPKVKGTFAYGSDLWADGMLWGATLRSPLPHAAIEAIDVGPALAVRGVRLAVTADDLPGPGVFGIEHADQPVLARDVVRFCGEPVAIMCRTPAV